MKKPGFVEVEFVMPIGEMYFPDCWNANNLPRNPFELSELSSALEIIFDPNFILDTYDKLPIERGDAYVFYSSRSKDIFLYFDLLKDKYDQMTMIQLGVRIPTERLPEIRPLIEKLYFKSTTRSDWQEDYYNQTLWRNVTDRNPAMKRKVHHFENGIEVRTTQYR